MSLVVKVNQPFVSFDLQQDILNAKDLFEKTARVYAPVEVALMFSLYNRVFNQNKKDTGCGGCRRNIMNALLPIYKYLKNQKQNV